MTRQAAARKKGFRLFRYIGEIISELKKVVWLTRREMVYLTVMVIVVSVAAGIFLGAVDYGFTELLDRVFLGG